MLEPIKQLAQSKDLLWTWTQRIIQTRYQQSVLGGLWIILQPTATAAIFTIIFTFFVPVATGNIPYVIFSFTALTPWMLFANSLNDMANSLVDNMSLVTKIYFPREVLPIAALFARLMDFFIAAGLLVVLMLVFRVPAFPLGWLFVPVILATQLALILGFGLALAAMNVFYRDVRPLLTLGIQLWFYASPIIYPVALVPEHLRPYYFLNPMAGVLEAYRDVLLNAQLPGWYLVPSIIIGVSVLVVGYWFFKRVEFQIADIV